MVGKAWCTRPASQGARRSVKKGHAQLRRTRITNRLENGILNDRDFAQRLGLFDATMIGMAGIFGAGISPMLYVVANHLFELIGARSSEFSAALLGSAALVLLTVINCIGVRAGSVTQNIFMILKLIAIATLVILGLLIASPAHNPTTTSISSTATTWQSLIAFGAALIPTQFAYGGVQTGW